MHQLIDVFAIAFSGKVSTELVPPIPPCLKLIFCNENLELMDLHCDISAETSSNYKQHRRTPSTSSTLTFSARDDDDGMVTEAAKQFVCITQ